jgi:Fur family zinc uptake transcriptional regulator
MAQKRSSSFRVKRRRTASRETSSSGGVKANDALVQAVLGAAKKPLTAYDILAQLKPRGISGPPTVYRALDNLMKAGQVHRIQSLNAFVLCKREEGCTHTHHNTFMLCGECGDTQEIHDDRVSMLIEELSKTRKFRVMQESLEIIGRCGACST